MCAKLSDWFPCADWFVRQVYRRAAVQMQRIDSVKLSPVFSLYGELLSESMVFVRSKQPFNCFSNASTDGLMTLRAFHMHETFRQRFYTMTNESAAATTFYICAQGWLRTRTLMVSFILVSACAFLIVGFRCVLEMNCSYPVASCQLLPLFAAHLSTLGCPASRLCKLPRSIVAHVPRLSSLLAVLHAFAGTVFRSFQT